MVSACFQEDVNRTDKDFFTTSSDPPLTLDKTYSATRWPRIIFGERIVADSTPRSLAV